MFWGLCFLFVSFFLLVFLEEENQFSPPKRAILFIFQCPPLFFSPIFLEIPLFTHSFSLSLSLFFLSLYIYIYIYLSLSLLLLFFASFNVFFCFVLPCLLVFTLFVLRFPFLKRTASKYSIRKVVLMNHSVFFVGFLSCFAFQIPFSYLVFFCSLSCVFVQHQSFYVSKKTTYKTPIVGEIGGCNKT